MNETALKHVIALLLEDARRIQQLEPNAGTEARIFLANAALVDDIPDDTGSHKDWGNLPGFVKDIPLRAHVTDGEDIVLINGEFCSKEMAVAFMEKIMPAMLEVVIDRIKKITDISAEEAAKTLANAALETITLKTRASPKP